MQGKMELNMDSPIMIALAGAAGLGLSYYCFSAPPAPAAVTSANSLKEQLLTQGYCVVPAAMTRGEIANIAETCHELLGMTPPDR